MYIQYIHNHSYIHIVRRTYCIGVTVVSQVPEGRIDSLISVRPNFVQKCICANEINLTLRTIQSMIN